MLLVSTIKLTAAYKKYLVDNGYTVTSSLTETPLELKMVYLGQKAYFYNGSHKRELIIDFKKLPSEWKCKKVTFPAEPTRESTTESTREPIKAERRNKLK